MLEEKKLTFHSAHFLSAGSGNGAGQQQQQPCCGLWDSCQTMSPPVWTTCWPSACRVKVTWRDPVRRACGLMCGTVAWEGHQPRAISLPSSPSSTNNNCTAASPKTNPTVGHSPSSNIMLPCEFCEELFPVEDLILHQVSDEASIIPSRYTHSWLDI